MRARRCIRRQRRSRAVGAVRRRRAAAKALFNETCNPTALRGGNNGCKPSAAHPYPVVLVHATFADEGSNWVTLSPLLANNGYCVYGFNYGRTILSGLLGAIDGLGHIERSAEELRSVVNNVLAKTGASKVDLVGHSQGGMMPNYYLASSAGASKVHTLIGLAPSNHGTTLDGLTELVEEFPFASLVDQLVPRRDRRAGAARTGGQGSAFMKKLFGSGDTVAGPRYVVIETTHDEVVTPYTNAFLNGQRHQHHDPEPVPERSGRAHRDVRGLAVAAERAEPALGKPEQVVPGDVCSKFGAGALGGRNPAGLPARAGRPSAI